MSKVTITLQGYLSKDPEVKNDGNLITLTVPVKYTGSKNADGEPIDDWYVINAWGDVAERVSRLKLKKGSPVSVTGSLAFRKYTKKDETEATTNEVTAYNVDYVISSSKASDTKEASTEKKSSKRNPLTDDPFSEVF